MGGSWQQILSFSHSTFVCVVTLSPWCFIRKSEFHSQIVFSYENTEKIISILTNIFSLVIMQMTFHTNKSWYWRQLFSQRAKLPVRALGSSFPYTPMPLHNKHISQLNLHLMPILLTSSLRALSSSFVGNMSTLDGKCLRLLKLKMPPFVFSFVATMCQTRLTWACTSLVKIIVIPQLVTSIPQLLTASKLRYLSDHSENITGGGGFWDLTICQKRDAQILPIFLGGRQNVTKYFFFF